MSYTPIERRKLVFIKGTSKPDPRISRKDLVARLTHTARDMFLSEYHVTLSSVLSDLTEILHLYQPALIETYLVCDKDNQQVNAS